MIYTKEYIIRKVEDNTNAICRINKAIEAIKNSNNGRSIREAITGLPDSTVNRMFYPWQKILCYDITRDDFVVYLEKEIKSRKMSNRRYKRLYKKYFGVDET